MSSFRDVTLLTILFCLNSWVTGVMIYATKGENKVIQWTITPAPGNVFVQILHPSNADEVLYAALGTNHIQGAGNNADRVTDTGNTNTNTGHVEFTLNDVAVTDAGDYRSSYAPSGGTTETRVGVTLLVYVRPTKPVITAISNSTLVVGRDFVLQCTTSSNSKPDGHLSMKYKWFLGNSELPADSRYVTKGSQLQVKSIQKSDKDSTFTCVGYENTTLQSLPSDGHTLDIKYGPDSVTLSPDRRRYEKVENENINSITCSADCNPPCEYQWKLNGANVGGQGNKLSLNNIQRGQAGTYVCTASNDYETRDSHQITVTLKYGPRSVMLSPNTLSYIKVEVTRNTLGPITCSADCNPNCTYQWSRGEKVFRSAAVLELLNATRMDDGSYICDANNSYGNQKSESVRVMIEYKPEDIKLEPSTQSYVRIQFERLGPINCSATCKPACSYQWRHNNFVIHRGSVLDINKINNSQSGNYTCEASNKHGNMTATGINVDVQYPPYEMTITPQNTSYNILEKTPLYITCNAICNPNCTYQWRLNGSSYDNIGAVLSIAAVKRSGSGNYSCSALNTRGQRHIDVIVTVEYPPGQIKITPAQTNYSPLEHKDTLGPITCDTDCKPRCMYKWKHNGGHLTNGTELRIEDITRAYSGTYQCYSWNKHGHRYSKSVFVAVQFPPERTNITTNMPDRTVKENDTLSVSCTTNSVPSSTMRVWLEADSPRIVLQTESTVQVNYTKPAECLDTGKYFCDARNEYGNSSSNETDVNVLCSPRLGTGLPLENTVGIGDRESLKIMGTLIAYPRPNISLMFIEDGTNVSITIGNDTGIVIFMSSNNAFHNFQVVKKTTEISDFGDYIMNASNPYGSVELVYHVISKRSPDPPYNLSLSCETTEAKIQWTSNFNGGVSQNFIINVNKAHRVHSTYTVPDRGMTKRHEQIVTNLNPNTKFSFVINATNSVGSSGIQTPIFCTTRPSDEEPSGPGALIGGVVGGIAFVLLIVVIILAVMFLLKRRRTKKDESTELMHGRGKPLQDDPDDGIRRNILYESAGPFLERQNDSSAECQYAAVDKSAKKKDNPADVYAVVEKKGKKQNRKGEVYENFGGDFEDEYANANIEPSGSGAVGGADNEVAPSRRKNKDGLVYVDVVIGNTGKGKKNGIHGIEKRVDYVDIDFSRRADPLPSDDEEDEDNQEKNND